VIIVCCSAADDNRFDAVSTFRVRARRPCMRKIKSNFFISLDGVVESPDEWHFPYFNDQMGAAIGAGAATSAPI
jgi:hypothetical protein